jgi:phage terminase large subunit
MDLGWGVQTMLLAQRFASTVQIIGYHEWRNKTYAHLTDELRKEYPTFRWGKIFMPHDASHKDPKTGKSHYETMNELGWETAEVPQIGVENYISLGREMFNNVYISDKCTDLINCLRRFKYRLSADTERRTGVDKDDFSHGGETWCYTAVVADEMTNDDSIITNPYGALKRGYAA